MQSTAVADVSARREEKKAEREAAKGPKELTPEFILKAMNPDELKALVDQLTIELHQAAKDLEFERAADMRDEIKRITEKYMTK
jgi:excinuclease ABC subunit B